MDVKKFLEIEKKHNLYEKEVLGVNYWIFHRFSIWNYNICAKSLGLNTNFRKKKKTLLKTIKIVRYLLPKKKYKNIDILFLNHERRVKQEKYYECIYTEKLSEYFKNSVTFEEPFENAHFKPTKTKNLYYLDGVIIKSSIYWRLIKFFNRKKYNNIKNKIYEQIHLALDDLCSAFDWNYDKNSLLEKFTITVLQHKYIYNKYYKLVKKVNPKVIVEVVHYGLSKMIFNEVAHELGIKVIELQHGTIYDDHLAYQYNTSANIKQLPNNIFLFSDFWKKSIHAPLNNNELIATGFPFFESKIQEYKDKKIIKDKYTILFISQGTIGNKLYNLAYELSKKLDDKKYRIIFKLHPSEYSIWRETYKNSDDSKIQIVDNNDENIYYYFAQSDMQIGAYSTAIFEGIGFGLKTLVFKVGHYEIMDPLIKAKYANYVENVQDIISEINNKDFKISNNNKLWMNNSFNNIVDLIEQYINNKN